VRTSLAWWGVYLRGIAMGTADVVPGVSGGTMALVLGIYERLVAALRAATGAEPWRALRQGGVGAAWRAADAPFLLPLVAGIATAVLLLARVVEAALVDHRVLLYAAFTGLVAASVVVVARQVRGRSGPLVAVAVAAAAVTFWLLGLAPAATPDDTWFLVLAGAIGISALVLPGVSGAFLLVVLGQYQTVLGAIGRFDVSVLVPFALGALIGLATVARILDALLRRARALTLAALAGIMVGSLRRLWPWIEPGEAALHEVPQREVFSLPPSALGPEGWVAALAVALTAAGAVALLEWSGARRVPPREPFSSGS
jgi:putative membrane protein